jgi:hypothetical protein
VSLFNIRDYGCSPGDLEIKYEKKGEHPTYSMNDWRWAVRERYNVPDYWIWVMRQLEQEREDLEQDNPHTQWEREGRTSKT